MEFKQFRRLANTGFARMHFGRTKFFAVKRAEPGGEILLQRYRPPGRNHTGRVQRAAESVRCPATAKMFHIGERDGSVAGNVAPGMKHGLGAVTASRSEE